jgi:acetoin utilization deacetylase AcuC-like enzyme
MGSAHPECAERLHAIDNRLIAAGLSGYLQHYDAPQATIEQLARVHTPDYIANILAKSPAAGLVRVDPDTSMNPFTVTAARRAAGAVVLASELVSRGETENAFCNIRPPGHHAERAQAMGFCFFNNVAVGAAHALETFDLQRVAIVDFDAHHGNGTEDIFEHDPRILVCSTYQHPLYPFSGRASVPGHLINVPLKAGTWGKQFQQAVSEHWLPALRDFQPQMLFISAGFDGHIEDDMSELNLVEADYIWVTQLVLDIATQYAGGRVVSVLEGGYALSALGRSAVVHIRTLMGI